MLVFGLASCDEDREPWTGVVAKDDASLDIFTSLDNKGD